MRRLGELLTACLLAVTTAAADWPIFRGNPALTGVATEALPAATANLWTFKAGGPVKSSAVVADGRVFVGSDDGQVYALALADGKKLWAFKTDGPVEAAPFVRGDTVYVGSSDFTFYALAVATGELRWKQKTGAKILGGANAIEVAGAWRVLVGSYDAKLYCFDAVTGKELWTVTTDSYVHGTPAVAGGRVVSGGCDGHVRILDPRDGKQLAEIDTKSYIAGSTVVIGDWAWLGHYNYEVLGLNLAEAKERWRFRDRWFPYYSSPAVTEKLVVIGGRDKKLHALDRVTGKEVWAFATQGKVDSSPVVCGENVVVGSDDGRLYAVKLADGTQLWARDLGAPVTATPAVVKGLIIVGTEDGTVYCLGTKP